MIIYPHIISATTQRSAINARPISRLPPASGFRKALYIGRPAGWPGRSSPEIASCARSADTRTPSEWKIQPPKSKKLARSSWRGTLKPAQARFYPRRRRSCCKRTEVYSGCCRPVRTHPLLTVRQGTAYCLLIRQGRIEHRFSLWLGFGTQEFNSIHF